MGLDTALDTLLHNGRGTLDSQSKIYGVVPALVTAVNDPKSNKRHMMGMIQVYFPWLQNKSDPNLINPWARVAMPNAGGGAGFYTIPQIGDEVIVGFEHGDPQHPYVVGSLWNGASKIPAPKTDSDSKDCKCHHPGAPTHKTPDLGPDSISGDKGGNKEYFWRSRSGNMIILDDKEGTVRIEEKTGKSVIQLEKDQIKVLQRSGDGIFVFAKEKIRLDCKNWEVHATHDIYMHAQENWGLKSDAHTTLEAGSKFNGTSKAEEASNGVTGIGWSSDKDLDIQAGTTLDITAGQNLLAKSASADFKVKAGLKFSCTSKADLGISTKAKLSVNAMMGITMGTKGEMKFDAGGNIVCTAMCINLN
ncbi:MAG TPA: phage baseplate assembly protein V [Planctomycetota bacterium]|nr:phage baseplate assembly protein V [Planctomycetota bacterium]